LGEVDEYMRELVDQQRDDEDPLDEGPEDS
jgi:hypothetical protein